MYRYGICYSYIPRVWQSTVEVVPFEISSSMKYLRQKGDCVGWHYLSHANYMPEYGLLCFIHVSSARDHRNLPKYQPLVKNTCIRQFDKWFSLGEANSIIIIISITISLTIIIIIVIIISTISSSKIIIGNESRPNSIIRLTTITILIVP